MRGLALPVAGGDRGAAVRSVGIADDAAQHSHSVTRKQRFDDLGHRLPPRRHEPTEGAPRRARPGWYALAVDRWTS